MMEPVDTHNSMQNAFVQDWLTAYMKEIPTDQDDYDKFEAVIEGVQETYNYQDHDARKNAVTTGGDLDACLRVLGKLMETVPEGDVGDPLLFLAYAFVNAVKQNARES